MEHSFDVVRDPWIPVRGLDGKLQTVSIRGLIQNSHTYEKIEDMNSKYEYGMFTLILSFLYSTYSLPTIKDKGNLLKLGHFDILVFDKYIAKCEALRPNCFNLFGENPFYQNKNMQKKTATAMVGKIALDIPSGNNSLHWASKPMVNKFLSFDETAKALCSYSAFQANQDSAGNSATGPNGGSGYPEYLYTRWENLFKSLVLNMITETTWELEAGENSQYRGNAAWEDTREHTSKEETKYVSLVEGLTFQNRFVLLNKVNSANQIEDLYFGSGRVFKRIVDNGGKTDKFKGVKDSSWRQPNGIFYYKNIDKSKTETVSVLQILSPNKNRPIWLDMPLHFKQDKKFTNFAIQELYRLISDGTIEKVKNIYYSIYYTSLNGSYLPAYQTGVYENYMPYSVLSNEQLLDYFNTILSFIIEVGECINSDIVSINLQNIYYMRIETEYLPKIFSIFESFEIIEDIVKNDEKLLTLCNQIAKEVIGLAKEIYNTSIFSSFSTKLYEVSDANKKKYKVGFYGKANLELGALISGVDKKMKERGLNIDD